MPRDTILIRPVGTVDSPALRAIAAGLRVVLEDPVRFCSYLPLPHSALDAERGQYLSPALLSLLRESSRPTEAYVLGVCSVDLFAPGLNFVFGEAEPASGTALISFARLHGESTSSPADHKLFHERALKEAVHEVGHLKGLEHCPDPSCVMHSSNSLADTDRKNALLCTACAQRIEAQTGQRERRDRVL